MMRIISMNLLSEDGRPAPATVGSQVFQRLGFVSGPPAGYQKVRKILLDRKQFPNEEWTKRVGERSLDLVMSVMERISEAAEWPNHNFHPDDSVFALVAASTNEHAFIEIARAIKLSSEEFTHRSDLTCGDLVNRLLIQTS